MTSDKMTSDKMKAYSIVLGGCAYNNAKMLPRVLRNISFIAGAFRNAHIVFFYDTSTDATLRLLQQYQTRIRQLQLPNTTVTILINPLHHNPAASRTANIARARNGILEWAQRWPTDLLAMIDLNEYACVGPLQLETLAAVFTPELFGQWDAVSFNREAGYYDYWALSFPGYIYSCLHYAPRCNVVTRMREVFKKMLHTSGKNLIPVYSAFNGFSIYKRDKFRGCHYSSQIDMTLFPQRALQQSLDTIGAMPLPNKGKKDDCEHRQFHLQAIKKHGARIRIYPHSLFRKLPVSDSAGLRGPA
jgi:hypothetical protein